MWNFISKISRGFCHYPRQIFNLVIIKIWPLCLNKVTSDYLFLGLLKKEIMLKILELRSNDDFCESGQSRLASLDRGRAKGGKLFGALSDTLIWIMWSLGLLSFEFAIQQCSILFCYLEVQNIRSDLWCWSIFLCDYM